MKVRETPLPGVLVLEPDVFGDDRGQFLEIFQSDRYREAGIDRAFVQDNLSFSRRGVVRGLHYQNPRAQAKLISAVHGEIFDVAVDIRAGSPTFGRWFGELLSAQNRLQLWIPEGFAHGFAVLSESATVHYKSTGFYDAACEGSLLWNDLEVGIVWPVSEPILSDKDAKAPRLAQLDKERLVF